MHQLIKNKIFQMSFSTRKTVYLSVFYLIILSFLTCHPPKNTGTKDSMFNGFLFNHYAEYNPTPMLNGISNQINTGYRELNLNAFEFKSYIDTYPISCDTANNTVSKLQSLWKSNMSKVIEMEIVQFGPAINGGFYESINPWSLNNVNNPPDIKAIDSYIKSMTILTTQDVQKQNKYMKGLPAIEYLLFNNELSQFDETSICNSLTKVRLEYLKLLVTEYYQNVNYLYLSWETNSGNYSSQLSNAGIGSIYFETKKLALDQILTQFNTILEKIKDNKIGTPSGFTILSGSISNSNIIESKYSNYSTFNIINNLIGLKKIYAGENGNLGFSNYVSNYSPLLDQRIKIQIDTCIYSAGLITNLKNRIETKDLTLVRETYNCIGTLKTLFTTELTLVTGSSGNSSSTGSGDGD